MSAVNRADERVPLSPCGRGARGEGSARQRLARRAYRRDPSCQGECGAFVRVGFADTFSRKGRGGSARFAQTRNF
jgi:hypothetical protein